MVSVKVNGIVIQIPPGSQMLVNSDGSVSIQSLDDFEEKFDDILDKAFERQKKRSNRRKTPYTRKKPATSTSTKLTRTTNNSSGCVSSSFNNSVASVASVANLASTTNSGGVSFGNTAPTNTISTGKFPVATFGSSTRGFGLSTTPNVCFQVDRIKKN